MQLFHKILTKLGIEKPKVDAAHKAKLPVQRTLTEDIARQAERLEMIKAIKAGHHSKEIPLVDVMDLLEKLAAEKSNKLNWKTSIADLLLLLDVDNSYKDRKELAIELRCPAEKMDDSAQMNTWLHKTVLQKIAENGGNIPFELLS